MRPDSLIKITGDAGLGSNSLSVNKNLAEQLDLVAAQVITLQLGQYRIEMKVMINKKQSDDNLVIHPNVINKMGLQNNMRYAVIRNARSVRIGPLIGVAANLRLDKNKPFGQQSYFISQLINQAVEMGAICYAFSVNDINFIQSQIRGYTIQNNVWKKAIYPIPDVIYPRCGDNGFNRHTLRTKLNKMGVSFLNPPGLGKWGTFNIIAKNNALLKYLPDTRLLNNFQELDLMLKKYRHIYMKPVNGSQGKKIIRVTRVVNSKAYEYQYQSEQHQVKAKAYSISELEKNLRSYMGQNRYIAQQQINLLRSGTSIMDLRVMVQKDRTGNWLVTGKVFRIGRSDSITSNISGGGSVCSIKNKLELQFNDQEVQRIMNEVDFLALETARTLEGKLGPIGELGIDIGVDQNGRVWLIEANLKPARRIFSLIGDTETRLLSVQRPIHYAIYLAGF